MSDPVDIPTLLQESRAAHLAYQAAMPHMVGVAGHVTKEPGDPGEAHRQLLRAATLRRAAHEADPDHASPAWKADIVPHAILLDFYDSALAADGYF